MTLSNRWQALKSSILVPTPLLELPAKNGVTVFVKQDYLTHPYLSGNKWRKLKYALEAYVNIGTWDGIISFGGAKSNHVYSLVEACKILEIPLHLIIRGDELNIDSNSTLRSVINANVTVSFADRGEYRLKEDGQMAKRFIENHPNFMVLPEGGTSQFSDKGVGEVIEELDQQISDYDYLVTSMGTGGTVRGLAQRLKEDQKLVVYPALKGAWINEELKRQLSRKMEKVIVRQGYEFGGYAKGLEITQDIVDECYKQFKIKLDLVYTSKAWYGLQKDIQEGYFEEGSKIVFYHSGGLQSGYHDIA